MNYALDLAKRNGGYLVERDDPTILALHQAGLVSMQYMGDGYSIARAVQVARTVNYRNARGRWSPRAADGRAALA